MKKGEILLEPNFSFLSFSLTLAHTHAHSLSLSHTCTLPLSLTHTLSHTLSLCHTNTHTNTYTHSLCLSLTHKHTHTHHSWGRRAAHNRAQIVYYIAENLELRHDEVAQRIADMTGKSIEDSKKEVDLSIQRLFYWGAYADKYGGTVQVSVYGMYTIDCFTGGLMPTNMEALCR